MAKVVSPWITDGPLPYRTHGSEIQILELVMRPGEKVVCQPDSFLAGGGGVKGVGINWGRRLMDPIYRSWSGEAGILQEFACEGEPARIFFSKTDQIGQIVRIPLSKGRTIICQKGAFLVGTGKIDHGIAITRRIRAGLFGKQGFVFQRLSGEGDVFLQVQGTHLELGLEEDRKIMVSTNNILAYEASVGYDMQISGGLLSLLSAGQGLFLSQLEGPGMVYLQSLDHGTLSSLTRRKKKEAGPEVAPLQEQPAP